MATTANVITTPKFIQAAGVLLLLGISLKSVNGNHGLSGYSSHGLKWGLHKIPKISLNSTIETINGSIDEATTTTEEPFETTTIEQDATVVLTLSKPDEVLTLTSGSNYSLRFLDHDEYSGYRQRIKIVIHLWDCYYNEDESIQIFAVNDYNSTYINETWKCPQNQSVSNSTALLVVKDIIGGYGEVWIAARFNSNSTREGHQSKATVIANIYWEDYDSQETCGSRFFDCMESYDYCPPCCEVMDFRTLMCIPIQLQCNERPNCGAHLNTDETYETCYLKTSCPPCPAFCLSWNYIITSLAIAVLFIVTPTVIVFGLFYRRNVALERARLERYAQARMADMRGEYTLDSPVTDVPPSYEEVYDTKEPPPCFCQAVAMGEGVEVLQLQAQSVDRINGDQDVDVTIQDNPGAEGLDSGPTVGMQNLGFHCSCRNLEDLAVDSLPSYMDVRESSNITVSASPSPISDSSISNTIPGVRDEIVKVEV